LIEEDRVVEGAAHDYIAFHVTGERAKGAYRCTDCGYGVAVSAELPRCPMCGGEVWEEAAWSPFGRARSAL
jgi:rubrerythrin